MVISHMQHNQFIANKVFQFPYKSIPKQVIIAEARAAPSIGAGVATAPPPSKLTFLHSLSGTELCWPALLLLASLVS